MRLLYYDGDEIRITEDLSDNIPAYAILSHTWGKDEDELKFQEVGDPDKRKLGYRKIQLCGEQAKRDGLGYFWVDSCCIDNTSTADLTKNINSMFRYYHESKKCYVYLSDVNSVGELEKSRWFTRGWTLQELLAPTCVEFYTTEWQFIGNKSRLEDQLHSITQIPVEALSGELSQFSTEERMRWTINRQTREKEDKAYCLLGIFDVSMNLRYGEGEDHAFARLENKIKKKLRFDSRSVDALIRNYYLTGSRLDIERLSGQCLPMERCFINLGIIDKCDSEEININLDTAPSTLTARLKVETPDQAKQVNLQTLFDARKLAHGRNGQPTRVIIWGRAGIGKTTLCKKIVNDFYSGSLWHDLYSRIFWLPLRRLKLMRDENKTVAEIIQEVCFHGARDGAFSSDQFDGILNARCLFILDGLDEVSSTFDPESPMGANLNRLLSQQNVIITSRPHSTNHLHQIPPDLELETVGFFPEQVIEYLHKETDLSQSAVDEIQKFISQHPVMQSLVRIPIQLDAICYIWSTGISRKDNMTMTALYQAISDCLWKKDIVRLNFKFEGERITPQQVQYHTNIRFMAEREASYLELLAFFGLYNQLVEFSSQHINTITESQDPVLIDRLYKSSFLRSSDNLLNSAYQTHHFIHLTFQEFFAARYFVSQFVSGRTLKIFKVAPSGTQSSQNLEEVYPVRFIEKEKYNVRFDFFWRFVAGILQSIGDSHLHRFFERLESEPIDCLGPAHQRLTIHCLKELDTTVGSFSPKARELEQYYKDWTQFELQFCNTSRLLAEGECPGWIITSWLYGDDTERITLLEDLKYKSNVPVELLKVVIQISKDVDDEELRDVALAVIAKHCDCLSEDVVLEVFAHHDKRVWLNVVGQGFPFGKYAQSFNRCIIPLLQKEDFQIRSMTLAALEYQSDLPDSAIEIITELLHNPDQASEIRVQAACVLEQQNKLSESATKIIGQLFQDPDRDSNTRISAVMLLERIKSLPESVIEMLVQVLQNRLRDRKIRLSAANILARQNNLPEFIYELLIQLLQDRDCNSGLRLHAAHILHRQDRLTESAVRVILELFQDEKEIYDNRLYAATFLEVQSQLSEPVIEGIVALIKSKVTDFALWLQATRILEQQIQLPGYAVEIFVKILLDEKQHFDNRYRAAHFLEGRNSLPESGIRAVVDLLQQQATRSDVRFRAAMFLGRQNKLPESAIEVYIQLLQNDSKTFDMKTLGADVARRFPSLTKKQLQSFLKMLRTKASAVNAATMLRTRAEFYPLIPTLDQVSIENLMYFWLRESLVLGKHNLVILRNGALFVETYGRQWTVPFKNGGQETFRKKWVRAQKAIGTPPYDLNGEPSPNLISTISTQLRSWRSGNTYNSLSSH